MMTKLDGWNLILNLLSHTGTHELYPEMAEAASCHWIEKSTMQVVHSFGDLDPRQKKEFWS